MNQFYLQLLCMFALLVGLVWAHRGELLREWCWAIGALQYNPGGLVVPAGYYVPTVPYMSPAARRNSAIWVFLSGTAASYNGQGFTLRRQNADGSYTSIQFEYYNTGGGPSLPIIGIDVTGNTTSNQMAADTALALADQGFIAAVTPYAADTIRVTQPSAGDAGDVGFFGDFDGAALISIGPSAGEVSGAFSIYGNTVFFGGIEIAVPLRVGPLLAAGPVRPAIFDGG